MNKCLRVIEGCKTLQQLNIAQRYFRLWMRTEHQLPEFFMVRSAINSKFDELINRIGIE